MINLEGIEKLINLLGNKNIVFISFIFSITGVIFFIPELLAFVRIPEILVKNGEWFRLIGCFSFVVLIVNIIKFGYYKISNLLKKSKNKKQILKDLLSLVDIEEKVIYDLLYYRNNKFDVESLAIIELKRKNIIYMPNTIGNQTRGNYLSNRLESGIFFPFAINPVALGLIKKHNLLNQQIKG